MSDNACNRDPGMDEELDTLITIADSNHGRKCSTSLTVASALGKDEHGDLHKGLSLPMSS